MGEGSHAHSEWHYFSRMQNGMDSPNGPRSPDLPASKELEIASSLAVEASMPEISGTVGDLRYGIGNQWHGPGSPTNRAGQVPDSPELQSPSVASQAALPFATSDEEA